MYLVAFIKAVWGGGRSRNLTTKSVQSTALALQSIDNVHGGDGLSLGVLSVGDCISDDILQEHLQHSTGLLVDQTADSLHSTTASETPDSWLGDSLDVIPENLPVTLCASFSKTFASFATSRHFFLLNVSKLANGLAFAFLLQGLPDDVVHISDEIVHIYVTFDACAIHRNRLILKVALMAEGSSNPPSYNELEESPYPSSIVDRNDAQLPPPYSPHRGT